MTDKSIKKYTKQNYMLTSVSPFSFNAREGIWVLAHASKYSTTDNIPNPGFFM